MLRRELEPIKGMMQGKLRLKGDLPTMVRQVKAAQELVNSAGIATTAQTTLVSAAVEVVAENQKDAQSAAELETVHFYDRLDVARIGEEAAKKAVMMLGARPAPSGKYPVVLSPEAATGLISVLAPAVGADAVMVEPSKRATLLRCRHVLRV